MTADNPAMDATENQAGSSDSRWPAWLRPFPVWFCSRPLLFGEALLFLAVLWGFVGVEFGAPYVFWTEKGWPQFFAGVGTAWLLGKLSFIGYLLDADAAWTKRRSPWWYLAVTWMPLMAIGALRAIIPAWGQGIFAKAFNGANAWASVSGRWPFVLGLILGAGVAALFVLSLSRLQMPALARRVGRLPGLKKGPAGQPQRPAAPEEVQRHTLALLFFAILLSLYLVLVFLPGHIVPITPALAICLLLGLVADTYGFLLFHFPRTIYPAAAVVCLVAIACGSSSYKHHFPGLDYSQLVSLDTQGYEQSLDEDCGLLNEEGVRKNWLNYFQTQHAQSKSDRPPKVVIVAASGGGIRAALWTATVLNELETVSPGFFYQVRLITGASGGMLGGAHFTAKLDQLKDFDVQHRFRAWGQDTDARKQLLQQRTKLLADLKIVDNLEKGALGSVAQYWVLRDVPHLFWPLAYDEDRGWALEKAWSANLEGALDRAVRELGPGEEQGWRPSLVFSPMLVEDGRRLLISNLGLDALTRNEGSILDPKTGIHKGLYSQSAVEFFRLFPRADSFTLGTAVRMNASFPYISPAVALPTNPPRRVVDAGYYDNYGINVAAAWIYKNQDWIVKNTSGVVLIQIRDQQSQHARTDLAADKAHPSTWLQLGLDEITTPLSGGLSALEASMSFRNDEQLRILSDVLNKGRASPDMFTTIVFECVVSAELNWSLTENEIRAIRGGVKEEITDQLREAFQNYPNVTSVILKNANGVKTMRQLLRP